MNIKAKNDTVISVRTSNDTNCRLSRLAKATNRSKSYLAHQAIEQYIDQEEAFITAVAEGVTDAEAGRLYTEDEVAKKLEVLITKTAKCK